MVSDFNVKKLILSGLIFSIVFTLMGSECLLLPKTALASSNASQNRNTAAHWKPVIKKWFKFRHCYSKKTAKRVLRILKVEAKYKEKSHRKGSKRWGLGQFSPKWHATPYMKEVLAKRHHHKAKDWRKCGECSIYRIAVSVDTGGTASLYNHWEKWW